jgi:hypothetical protein
MNKHIGSTLDSFLEEEGIKEKTDLRAKKKIIADDLRVEMERSRMTRSTLAKRMRTSRTLVNRLLDPTDTSVTLETLSKASRALHMDLQLSLKRKTRRAS